MLTFKRQARNILRMLGELGKARYAMVLGRSNRKKKNTSNGPCYIHTAPHDGRKYVDLDEFLKDKKVRRKIKQLAEQAGHR